MSSDTNIEVFLGSIGILATILCTLIMLVISVNSYEEIGRRDIDLIANSIVSSLSQMDMDDKALERFGPNAIAIAEDLANRRVIFKKIKRDNGESIYYTLHP